MIKNMVVVDDETRELLNLLAGIHEHLTEFPCSIYLHGKRISGSDHRLSRTPLCGAIEKMGFGGVCQEHYVSSTNKMKTATTVICPVGLHCLMSPISVAKAVVGCIVTGPFVFTDREQESSKKLKRFCRTQKLDDSQVTDISQLHSDTIVRVRSTDLYADALRVISRIAHNIMTFAESRNKYLSRTSLGQLYSSHELLNLATAIVADGTELADLYKSKRLDEVRERLDTIASSCLTLDGKLNRFISQEYEELRDLGEKQNICDIVAEIANTFEGLASKKGLVFEINGPTNELYSFGSREKMRTILSNLVENAVKYSHYGRENNRIEINIISLTKDIMIEVINFGRGIPRIETYDVVKPHKRGYFSRTKPGSGLGLSQAKELIEELGGSMPFPESRPIKKGYFRTHFKFFLPIYSDADFQNEKKSTSKRSYDEMEDSALKTVQSILMIFERRTGIPLIGDISGKSLPSSKRMKRALDKCKLELESGYCAQECDSIPSSLEEDEPFVYRCPGGKKILRADVGTDPERAFGYVRSGPLDNDPKFQETAETKTLSLLTDATLHVWNIMNQCHLERKKWAEETSNTFHSLKTPLTLILVDSAILLDYNLECDDNYDRLVLIGHNCMKLNFGVGNLRGAYSMIKLPPHQRGGVDIVSLLKQALEIYDEEIRDKVLEVAVDIPKTRLRAWGQSDNILRAIANLVDNAVHYCPTPSLHKEFKAPGRIEVSLKDGKKACLSLINTSYPFDFSGVNILEKGVRPANVHHWAPGSLGIGLSETEDILRHYGHGISVNHFAVDDEVFTRFDVFLKKEER
ncbi:MAG: HAMP domain-containing histidine kinase [Thermoplasmata archaeon]|nr:HAMP domain-containing histidine kinase [Thermoplasmata archaeon]